MKIILLTIILSVTNVAIAGEAKVNEWFVTTSQNGVTAGFMNSYGQIFQHTCYPKQGSCFYMVGSILPCSVGKTYPSIINLGNGRVDMKVKCQTTFYDPKLVDVGYTLVIEPYDVIDETVRSSKYLQIIIPNGDSFAKIKFDLTGAVKVIDKARLKAMRSMNKG